jgi:hypothetical protein
MADIPWAARVKQDGKLEVYPGPSLKGSPWAVVFKNALRDLNALLKRHKINLSFVAASTAPAEKGTGGADVAVEAASKNASSVYEGVSKSKPFDDGRMHGACFKYTSDQGEIEKAFVHLPDKPLINTPSGQRPVGAKVLLAIAAHELLHAAGLEEHTKDDLMIDYPTIDYGSTAANDKVIIMGPQSKVVQSMPPLYLAGKTLERIKLLWGAKGK